MTKVDIGIFAHNEERGIAAMLSDLARQSIFVDSVCSVRVFVLANGCTDDTASVATTLVSRFPDPDALVVKDFVAGGKSRTWNEFVHQISRQDSDIVVFCDADIALPEQDTIATLVTFMTARTDIEATSSMPVKDIDYYPQRLGLVERLISTGGGKSGNDVQTAICGQLYAMRAATARALRLPVGLPVEDGFVRHAIITQRFTATIDESRIDKASTMPMHIYGSERSLSSLLRHQVRVVIGNAVNATLFSHLCRVGGNHGKEQVDAELRTAAKEAQWLPDLLCRDLPNVRFGWVPWHFLLLRTQSAIRRRTFRSLRGLSMCIVGFMFDLLVFIAAQLKMASGKGAGYW